MRVPVPLFGFVCSAGVDGLKFWCYSRKLALVATGITPGLVTVALKSWQFNCKPTKTAGRGFLRLRANATRVPVPPPAAAFRSRPFVRVIDTNSRSLIFAGGSVLPAISVRLKIMDRQTGHPSLFSAPLLSR